MEMEEFSKHMGTAATIVSIRHTLDTRDEFYEKEDAYLKGKMPGLHALKESFMESKFRAEIEKEYRRGLVCNKYVTGKPSGNCYTNISKNIK